MTQQPPDLVGENVGQVEMELGTSSYVFANTTSSKGVVVAEYIPQGKDYAEALRFGVRQMADSALALTFEAGVLEMGGPGPSTLTIGDGKGVVYVRLYPGLTNPSDVCFTMVRVKDGVDVYGDSSSDNPCKAEFVAKRRPRIRVSHPMVPSAG